MTNDGDLAERLTHAKYGMTKTYRVWIHGNVPGEILDMLRRRVGKREAPQGGVRIITDKEHQPSRERRSSTPANMSVLEIDAREGRTEPLGEMLVQAGCRVKRIARISIGPLRLMGVSPGDWRDLTKDEVRTLKEAAGLGRPVQRARPAGPTQPERPEAKGGKEPPPAPPAEEATA
jgi:pseudouridine synthase